VVNNSKIIIFIMLFAAWNIAGTEPIKNDNSYSMTVELIADAAFDLDITLTLLCDKSVSVYEYDLPWRHWRSIVLVAIIPSDNGIVLEQSLRIDDPWPTRIVWKKNEVIRGKINLPDQFPLLTSEIKRNDIIIFWSYQLHPIDMEPFDRKSGWLYIPKSNKGSERSALKIINSSLLPMTISETGRVPCVKTKK